MDDIKNQLRDHCIAFVDNRIHIIQEAMEHTQIASKQETKSSMGDKYETGRALMQLELEKDAALLSEAIKLKHIVNRLSGEQEHAKVELGSLVTTDKGNYYFLISAGEIKLNDTTYTAVSLGSPLGMKAKGLRKGDSFELNKRTFHILNIN